MKYRALHILVLSLLIAVIPAYLCAQIEISIEAEDYTSSNNLGLETLRPLDETGCSSGQALYGFDYPEEWVEYPVSIFLYGTYVPSFFFQGEFQKFYTLRFEFTPCDGGDPVTVDVVRNGVGFG